MEQKRMDLTEFRDAGYLLEVNRQFFHRLGLALEMTLEEDGAICLSGVLDSRDDPEGFAFAELDEHDAERIQHIIDELAAIDAVRLERFGWTVQPFGAKV